MHTVGGVIGPRDALMDIVPAQRSLLIEGKVRPEDVAELAPGQRVDIQITAFRQRGTPLLAGTLRYVSADAITDTVNGTPVPPAPHDLVQVSVDAASESSLPAPLAPACRRRCSSGRRPARRCTICCSRCRISVARAFREH